ncbi:hypothetical protein BsWGS_16049 [Bradybaena similaris]
MTRSRICLFVLLVSQATASDYCTYNNGLTADDYKWCVWGCCDGGLLKPCCGEPLYDSIPFIAGITCGAMALIFLALAVLAFRRWRYNTAVQYSLTASPRVFITTTSSSDV